MHCLIVCGFPLTKRPPRMKKKGPPLAPSRSAPPNPLRERDLPTFHYRFPGLQCDFQAGPFRMPPETNPGWSFSVIGYVPADLGGRGVPSETWREIVLWFRLHFFCRTVGDIEGSQGPVHRRGSNFDAASVTVPPGKRFSGLQSNLGY